MRRIFSSIDDSMEPVRQSWRLSPQLRRELTDLLSQLGMHIVNEARGPVPLLTFGRRMLERLDVQRAEPVPLPHFADALKRLIRDMRHESLRVMSPTDLVGVGYVYNSNNPDTWPIRSSR